jgi:predicted metal-binding protein
MQCIKCGTCKGPYIKAKTKTLRNKEIFVNICESCIKQFPDKYELVK